MIRVSSCQSSVIVVALIAACSSQDVIVVEPPKVEGGAAGISVRADGEDSVFAAALGWSKGLPAADVTIADPDSGRIIVTTGHSDSLGAVHLASLVPGSYWIAVNRRLTDAERSRLPAGADVEGFAARIRTSVGPNVATNLAVPAVHRGSLVISEWAFQSGYYGQNEYDFGGFLELYNNADTTLYLDGIMVAVARGQTIETNPESCAQSAALFQDPAGIWVKEFDQFPGGGHDFPLRPGETTVVATDAIDHRPLFPNALDLRSANFEFHGSADVDNPAVPNMTNLGPFEAFYGHGNFFNGTGGVFALARPLDIGTLRRQLSPTGTEYRFVPKSQLLDAVAFRTLTDYGFTPCARLVDPAIVRDDARLLDGAPDPFLQSVSRRIYYVRPDGRPILQNTGSPHADLHVTSRTPGRIE